MADRQVDPETAAGDEPEQADLFSRLADEAVSDDSEPAPESASQSTEPEPDEQPPETLASESDEEQPPAEEPAPATEAAAEEPPAEEPPEPEKPAEPAPTQSEQDAGAESRTPEEMQQEYEQWYNGARDSLATSLYSISEDDAAALEGNLAEALPNLLAKVHMSVLTTTMQTIAAGMPSIMGSVEQQRAQDMHVVQTFTEAWPGLAKPEYEPELRRLASIHAQTSPTSSLEDRVREVGLQYCILNRIDPASVSGEKVAASAPTPPAPTPSGSNTAAPAPAAPATSSNPIEAFAEEIIQDETTF